MSDRRAEAELRRRLADEGFDADAWSNGPDFRYAAHEHGYDKVLVVAEGSITFGLPGRGLAVELHLGERLDLPADTVHDAAVGPAGVTCLEAHAPRGTLERAAVARGTTW